MSTQLMFTSDDKPFAVRFSGGSGKGACLDMLVTELEWNQRKREYAEDEFGYPFDLPMTAEKLLQVYVEKTGAKPRFKSASEWNDQARELENHRFRDDHRLRECLREAAFDARNAARDTLSSGLKLVK